MIDDPELERRYARILDRFASPSQGRPDERRKAPRVPVSTNEITAAVSDLGVKTLTEVQTKDISTSGICFFAERPFPVGTEIELSVATVFSLSSIVVSCEMEETDASFLEVRYRVRCRFMNEQQGMEVVVLAKEAELAGEQRKS